MSTPEDAVKKDVASKLDNLERMGDLIWHTRLQCGKVKTEWGTWLQLCKKGTSDFVCIFRNKEDHLSVMFIECKRSDKKSELNENQKEFYSNYKEKHKDLHFITVQSAQEVSMKIIELSYDRLSEIKL